MKEREKILYALQENNREMEKILSSLKTPKAYVLTLEKLLNHSFEDLISEMILILLSIELNKFYIKILPQVKDIFHKFKMAPLSKKINDPSPSQNPSHLGKCKEILMDSPPKNHIMIKNCIIWNIRGANNAEFKRHYKIIIQIQKPSLLALLETRMVDHTKLVDELDYTSKI